MTLRWYWSKDGKHQYFLRMNSVELIGFSAGGRVWKIIILDVKNSPAHPSNVLQHSTAHSLQQLWGKTVLGKNCVILSHVYFFSKLLGEITQTEDRYETKTLQQSLSNVSNSHNNGENLGKSVDTIWPQGTPCLIISGYWALGFSPHSNCQRRLITSLQTWIQQLILWLTFRFAHSVHTNSV